MGSPLGVIATIGGLVYIFYISGLGFKTTFYFKFLLFFHECLKIHRQINIPAIASDTAMIKLR
jgi:hypothetical protein